MNTKFIVVLVAAFIGMGMSMPSCPGQQAMQQQIDQLTQSNANLTRQLQASDAKIRALTDDMDKVKQLLKPMSDAIQAQKSAMDQLDANMKEIQTKMTALATAAAKPAPKAKTKAVSTKRHR